MARDLNTPPPYRKDATRTAKGWAHPRTLEVLETVSNLLSRGSANSVQKVEFLTPPTRGGSVAVQVSWNGSVSVPAGSSIVVTSTQAGIASVTLYAAAQTGSRIIYKKQVDNTTDVVVADKPGAWSIEAQTIGGSITDLNTATYAQTALTATTNVANGDTVTIGAKTYTFQTTLTNVDGNVTIGATAQASLNNLANAINLSGLAGTDYAAAMTVHPTATMVSCDGLVLTLKAKTAGTGGNSLASTETSTALSFPGATFNSGTPATANRTTTKTVSAGVASAAGSKALLPSSVSSVSFTASSYADGANLTMNAVFDKAVNVTAGAYLTVTSTAGLFKMYAAAQTNVTTVVFNKKEDFTTQQVIPASFKANVTLTGDGTNVSNGDTVTIDGKVFTFQSSLTNVDGNVKIGASAADSLTNLFNAINGTGGVSGTDYAAATVAHTTVTATNPTATTVLVTAKTAGTSGNAIAVSEASTHLAFGSTTLSGGIISSGEYTVAAQTIGGTIVENADTGTSANLYVSSQIADGAGKRVVS